MKKILLVLFSILILVCSAVNVFADESAVSETVSVEEGVVEDLDIEFNPSNFIDNLDKMIIGMIGIFIVIGVVIVLTYILNKATGKKN